MDEKLIETLREFAEAIKQLRREVRELQPLKDQVADLRQRVATLEHRAVDRDVTGAIEQLRREVDELKKRGSGPPRVALQPPARIPQETPLAVHVTPPAIPPATGMNPVKLIVSTEEAGKHLQTYSHPQYDAKLNTSTWKVDSEGNVAAYSVCWLFCWGKAKGLEPVQHIFDSILDVDFADFDQAVDHEWARRARDRRDARLEMELSRMISQLPRKPRRS